MALVLLINKKHGLQPLMTNMPCPRKRLSLKQISDQPHMCKIVQSRAFHPSTGGGPLQTYSKSKSADLLLPKSLALEHPHLQLQIRAVAHAVSTTNEVARQSRAYHPAFGLKTPDMRKNHIATGTMQLYYWQIARHKARLSLRQSHKRVHIALSSVKSFV